MCSFKINIPACSSYVRNFRMKGYLLEAHVRKNRLEKRTHPGLESAWTLVVVGQQETGGTLNKSLAD